jgi:hypothetical protein
LCVAKRSRVWMCKKCKQADCLEEFLTATGRVKVKKVGCQKICRGPVAGLKVRGRMEWFARVDRAKPMVALLRAADPRHTKRIRPALESRRVARRSGVAPR